MGVATRCCGRPVLASPAVRTESSGFQNPGCRCAGGRLPAFSQGKCVHGDDCRYSHTIPLGKGKDGNPEGTWTCRFCFNVNYPQRSKCGNKVLARIILPLDT